MTQINEDIKISGTNHDSAGQEIKETEQSVIEIPEEKPKMTPEEVSEKLISESLLKRKEWGKKYRISDKTLFDLFSEFSSMMMIAKADQMQKD